MTGIEVMGYLRIIYVNFQQGYNYSRSLEMERSKNKG